MLVSLFALRWFYWHKESLLKQREECSPQVWKPFLRVSPFLFPVQEDPEVAAKAGGSRKDVREKGQQDRPQEDALNQMKQACRSRPVCVKSISVRWRAAFSTAVFLGFATSVFWRNSKTFALRLACNTQVTVRSVTFTHTYAETYLPFTKHYNLQQNMLERSLFK